MAPLIASAAALAVAGATGVACAPAPEADTAPPVITAFAVDPPGPVHPGLAPGGFALLVSANDEGSDRIDHSVAVTSVESGGVVRSLSLSGSSGATAAALWDLRDDTGDTVPPGQYEVSVASTDGYGNRSREQRLVVSVIATRDIARRAAGKSAKSHAVAVASFGIRRAGRPAEEEAAKYVAKRLAEYGYEDVRLVEVPLKDGTTSRNVIAVRPGPSGEAPIVIVGAHLDSRADRGSPGGNDDASGVGVMLEVARVMHDVPTSHEIRFVGFGAEEIYDGHPDHHHEGSRSYAASLSDEEMARGIQMVNLDMVGVGDEMRIGTQRKATKSYAEFHLATARALGYTASFKSYGTGSDHEPFVKLGIPVVVYDRGPDPHYHTPRDTAARLDVVALRETARSVIATLVEQSGR